nr:hypothetical protein [Candidatus Freyarchaeota archaeon]
MSNLIPIKIRERFTEPNFTQGFTWADEVVDGTSKSGKLVEAALRSQKLIIQEYLKSTKTQFLPALKDGDTLRWFDESQI